MEIKKILVPVDGSEYSQKALLKAKELGLKFGSEITILTVVNFLKGTMYDNNLTYKEDFTTLAIQRGEKILEKSHNLIKDYPGTVNTIYKSGDIADEIINMAQKGGFDLVVIGSRGLGTFSRALLGSISTKVVHNIGVSTLVVK